MQGFSVNNLNSKTNPTTGKKKAIGRPSFAASSLIGNKAMNEAEYSWITEEHEGEIEK